jgi:hypothetical protein
MKDDELLRLFVGEKKANFYFKKWNNNQKLSWNWPAFLFAWFWLGYRKLYSHLYILLVIFIVIDILSFYLGNKDNAFAITFAFIYGFLGNYFYRLHAQKKLNKITSQNSSESTIQNEVVKQGGASVVGIFISIGLLLLYVLVTSFIYTVLEKL